MSSLQFKVFHTFLMLSRRLSRPVGEFDVAKDRLGSEAKLGRFKALVPAERQGVTVADLPAEWLTPPGVVPGRTLLYLHGGGFALDSINSHRSFAITIGNAVHARVLILEYRLAPEHPYPASTLDCLEAYRWLLSEGVSPERLIVAGDSAGGCLTLELLIHLRNQGLPLPAISICISPTTDLSLSGESYARNARFDLMLARDRIAYWFGLYLAGHDPCDPLVSPLFADLHGLTPLLIQVGSDELLLSDSLQFAERARAAGVDVTLEILEGGQHGLQFATSLLPEARQAVAQIGKYVEERLS